MSFLRVNARKTTFPGRHILESGPAKWKQIFRAGLRRERVPCLGQAYKIAPGGVY
jgi:hypothetical protein